MRDIVKDNLIYGRLFAERRARIKVTLHLCQGVCQSDVRRQRVYLSCVKCVYGGVGEGKLT